MAIEAKYLGHKNIPAQFAELVDALPLKHGEFFSVTDNENADKLKLFICCPQCGSSSFTGNHKITRTEGNIFSATRSLVMQCCNWHGWLTNNILHQ